MAAFEFLTATIARDACDIAEKFGFGIELDEFCTAENMDKGNIDNYMPEAKRIASRSKQRVFHAPFSEIFPSAVDPMMRALAMQRLNQAFALAYSLGYRRIVVHSGYMPRVYFKEWFVERSIEFWREFMQNKPDDIKLLLENVLDDEPDTLCKIADEVGDKRFKLCFDMGHANIVSKIPLADWVERCNERIAHVHAHNNFADKDSHNALYDGSINMADMLWRIKRFSPKASVTLEMLSTESSALWLEDNGFLKGEL